MADRVIAHEDVVLEIKVRLSGLSYEEAGKLRDLLRQPKDINMVAICQEIGDAAAEVAPAATLEVFSPWAEWRPALKTLLEVLSLFVLVCGALTLVFSGEPDLWDKWRERAMRGVEFR